MEPGVPPRPDLGTSSPITIDGDWATPIPRRRAPRAVALVAILGLLVSSMFAGASLLLRDAFRREGTPSEHDFIAYRHDGSPLRWNPCAPIRYVVNPGRSPSGSVADVHEAVARMSAATGIAFAYGGLTDEVPSRARRPYQPDRYPGGWAPVLIGWVDPGETDIPFEEGDDVAAAVARPLTPRTGEEVIVSGWIAMNEEDPNPPGFGSPGAQGPTVLHEWGHILGLDHVQEQGQLMEPSGGSMTDLGPGDLAGLERLGRPAGCLDVPRPA